MASRGKYRKRIRFGVAVSTRPDDLNRRFLLQNSLFCQNHLDEFCISRRDPGGRGQEVDCNGTIADELNSFTFPAKSPCEAKIFLNCKEFCMNYIHGMFLLCRYIDHIDSISGGDAGNAGFTVAETSITE